MDHASGGRLNRIGLTQMQPLFLEGMSMLEPCQQEGKMSDDLVAQIDGAI